MANTWTYEWVCFRCVSWATNLSWNLKLSLVSSTSFNLLFSLTFSSSFTKSRWSITTTGGTCHDMPLMVKDMTIFIYLGIVVEMLTLKTCETCLHQTEHLLTKRIREKVLKQTSSSSENILCMFCLKHPKLQFWYLYQYTLVSFVDSVPRLFYRVKVHYVNGLTQCLIDLKLVKTKIPLLNISPGDTET